MNLRRGRRREEDLDISINLISFIDVLLCLVIFFMVSTTFVTKARIVLTLPQASAAAKAQEEAKIEVAIDAQGQSFVNGQGLIDSRPETLRQALADAAKNLKDPAVVIDADKKTSHQSVIDVLDVARQLGLLRVSFTTELKSE
jgi:biopolymer transport protein ExbD